VDQSIEGPIVSIGH